MNTEHLLDGFSKERERIFTLLLVGGSLYLFFVLSWAWHEITYDDALISLRYSRMLAEGHGLVWNPGERVEGYSNFSWVILMALIRRMGGDIVAWAKIVGMLANLGTLLLLLSITARKAYDPFAAAALAMLAFFPPFVIWGVTGLETAFYTFLVTLLIHAALRERVFLLSLGALLLALTRPEGAFLGGVAYLLCFFRSPGQRRAFYRWGGIALALYLGYTLWRILYFGDLFPNTFYAKATGGHAQFWMGLRYLRHTLRDHATWVPWIVGVPLFYLLRRRPVPLRVLLPFALVVAQFFFIVAVGGDWMWHKRFVHPVLPAMFLLVVEGLRLLWDRSTERVLWRIVVGIAFLLAFWQHTPSWTQSRYYLAFRPHPIAYAMESDLVPMGRRLSRFLEGIAPPHATLASNHVGVFAYYTDLAILDMTGLNDRHIAHLSGNRPLHTKFDADYVLRRRPEFIIINTRTPPKDHKIVADYWAGEAAVLAHPEFRKSYAPLSPIWKWGGVLGTAYTVVFCRNDVRPPGNPLP